VLGDVNDTEAERHAIRCRAVSKRFAGVVALEDVSLDVHAGEVAALIGPNGAGKTTLFNCITGALHPDQGEIWLGGTRIERSRSVRIARMGLARTFQNLRMFKGLTAYESVLAASGGRRRLLESGGSDLAPRPAYAFPSDRRGRALAALKLVALEDRADLEVSRLGLVEQRRLEIARALALQPRVLLLDEPAAGTTPREALDLVDLIRSLNQRVGLTVLLIEHTMAFVMECADRIHVLYFGQLMTSGTPAEILADEAVRSAYLGTRLTHHRPPATSPDPVVS
jgi:branched-chain amino acid transport system ATP-binding protein